MRHSLPTRDQLLMRLGAAKTEAGRAYGFVEIDLPGPGQAVTRASFRFRVDKAKLTAAQLRDGHYLLRSNLTAEDPAVLWTRYVQLTQIEAAFRSLKSNLRNCESQASEIRRWPANAGSRWRDAQVLRPAAEPARAGAAAPRQTRPGPMGPWPDIAAARRRSPVRPRRCPGGDTAGGARRATGQAVCRR